MQKNVIVNGTTYNGVDTVKLNTADGQASFVETSDATASAADIVKGKTAYANGVLVTGTHECEGGGITPSGTKEITANGTHDVAAFASVLVNVPTGGGSSVPAEFTDMIANIGTVDVLLENGTSAVGESITFQHNLGFVPHYLYIARSEDTQQGLTGLAWQYTALSAENTSNLVNDVVQHGTSPTSIVCKRTYITDITSTSVTISAYNANITAGTYRVFGVRFADGLKYCEA